MESPIDLNKPLVALDDKVSFFRAEPEQWLAISQIMGLIIATSISEMEECLSGCATAAGHRSTTSFPSVRNC